MDVYLMYLRKSRADSPYESVEEVLARHETILQNFAMQILGYTLPEECIYREVVSGETIEKRPEMQRILKKIEAPEVKGVLVVDPQRLSRGDLTDCGTIMTIFKYSRTNVLTPAQTYDLWKKNEERAFRDELMRGRDYLEYAKEVMVRGRKLSQSEGWYIGSVAPFGYDKVWVKVGSKQRLTFTPNPHEADGVRLAFESFVYLRMSTAQIADRLNSLGYKPRKSAHFNSVSIAQLLHNEVYAGLIGAGKRPKTENLVNGQIVISRPHTSEYKTFPGKHPAIISLELFEMAQERFGTLPRVKKAAELRNPFASLLYCSCGRGMSYALMNGKPRFVCNAGKYCDSRSIPYDKLCEKVIDTLKSYADNFEIKVDNGADAAIDKYNAEVERLQTALNDCNVQQDRLFTFLENGTYTEKIFRERNLLLAKRRDELQEQYTQLLEQAPPPISYEEMAGTLYEAIDAISSPILTAKQKNDFLKEIIEKIVYTSNVINDGTRWGKLEYDIDIFLKDVYIT